MIDWQDPQCMISKYFSVHEAIFLHWWNRLATEADGLNDIVKANLIQSCQQWDVVREFIGQPMLTSDMFRSIAYNALPEVEGAPNSWHTHGKAIDFVVLKMNCDMLRLKLLPMLPTWRIRVENRPGSTWVHCDTGPAFNNHWFFVP